MNTARTGGVNTIIKQAASTRLEPAASTQLRPAGGGGRRWAGRRGGALRGRSRARHRLLQDAAQGAGVVQTRAAGQPGCGAPAGEQRGGAGEQVRRGVQCDGTRLRADHGQPGLLPVGAGRAATARVVSGDRAAAAGRTHAISLHVLFVQCCIYVILSK